MREGVGVEVLLRDETLTVLSAGISAAAAIAANVATAPEPTQRLRQPAPDARMEETTTAEIMMPTPTPAKCIVDSDPRLANARRSSTSVEAHTITKALETPPMKRRPTKEVISDGSAMAEAETVL